MPILIKSASLEGFVIFKYMDRYPDAFLKMSQWMQSGLLPSQEDIENFPEVLLKLFNGNNFG
jgi:NADPH-dependent curcumin reductase CurA